MIQRLKNLANFALSLLWPNLKGQVSRHDGIGQWIQFLSSLNSVNTILEIGTWNGRGTSAAIVRGIRSRNSHTKDYEVVSVEVNPRMAKIATRLLRKHSWFNVVQGSLVDASKLDSSNLDEQEKLWFKQDADLIRAAQIIEPMPGKNIDLAVFDGGEFSTYAEFKSLEKRLCGWIVLDDTKSRKCKALLQELRFSPKHQIVWESEERNGVAVIWSITK